MRPSKFLVIAELGEGLGVNDLALWGGICSGGEGKVCWSGDKIAVRFLGEAEGGGRKGEPLAALRRPRS